MSIVENRKAFHDYFIEERIEAGLSLSGWEVKAIRAGRAHIKEAYVVVKNGELILIGAHITPLTTASTHVHADPTRTRKLLLHRDEINRLVGKVERAGYTLAPLDLHYRNGRVKVVSHDAVDPSRSWSPAHKIERAGLRWRTPAADR